MSNETHDYLFVYGTLRKEFNIPVKMKIADCFESISTAEIKGKLYDIGNYPGAVPADKNEKSVIRGEVIKILDPGKVLKILDEYEGYDPERSADSEYCRSKEKVSLSGGKEIEAWIYWYNFPVAGKKRIRHKDYLNYLKKREAL